MDADKGLGTCSCGFSFEKSDCSDSQTATTSHSFSLPRSERGTCEASSVTVRETDSTEAGNLGGGNLPSEGSWSWQEMRGSMTGE